MKLKHVGMIVVSVLAMSSAAVSAAEGDESVTTTVNGGVIHFKGEVVNAACAIDSESMNQTVELGQVRSSRLAKAGDLSSAVGFNIKLNDCGATTDSARQVFANTAPDATKASGVGVSLMRNGKILATGENVSLGTVNKSKVPLGLSATYGQTGNKVSAGTVQSVIGVTFIYE
ncbi:fimbrial protein [Escherichia coli]|nr:fimbrial protein [Escherichia coli]